jgi:hypothetical protein
MSAAALTYDSLVSDVQSYVNRSDDSFIDQIPRLILMAESRIASECRGLGAQKYVTGSIDSTTLEKPSRWRETISFSVVSGAGVRSYLYERGYEYCRQYPTTTGTPRYYADYGYEHFLVVPPKDAAYTFELSYYERVVPLSDTQQTNWYTQYAPQLLLYGVMLEAAMFLKNDEEIAKWQGLFDRAKKGLDDEQVKRVTDRTAERNKG